MNEQLDLTFDVVEQAFSDCLLRFTVDERPRPFGHGLSPFIDDRDIPFGTPVTWVHVISIPAGGEIRGYALVNGELRERGPYYLDWPEMDAAVSRRLGVPVYQRGRR